MTVNAVDSATAIVGQIHTDSFCEGCGYNLHGLMVKKDERLGILICQCPECGRFMPAGRTTSASQPLIKRAAVFFLSIWVLVVIYIVGMGTVGMGALDDALIMINTTYNQNMGQYRNASNVRVMRENPYPGDQIMVLSFTVLLPFVLGVLLAVFLWHLRRPWIYLFCIFPIGAAIAVGLIYYFDPQAKLIQTWIIQTLAINGIVKVLLMILGWHLGRPITRGILRVFLSPNLLQYFGFLWYRDGKQPPAVRTTRR